MATIEEKFSAKNCITSQIEGVISDLEHMTSGNFMHNRASARLLAKCALKEVEKVIAEQDSIARQEERERCIKAAQEWLCKSCCETCYSKHNITACYKGKAIHKAIEEGGNQ